LLSEWLNKPYIKKWYDPIDEWLDEVKNRRGEFSWLHHFIVMCDDTPIGFCQYYNCLDSQDCEEWNGRVFDKFSEVYSIDYLIGDENYLGKGCGKELIRILSDYVFSLGAAEIIVDPDKNNAASNAVLRANGYVFSGEFGFWQKMSDR
jgi:RimJ/RimL family protein N-acetyltransferase